MEVLKSRSAAGEEFLTLGTPHTARLASTAAFLLAAASMAHAEDAKIVKIDGNPNKSRAQTIAAAEEACRSARSHDFSDDFGSQAECVDNTLYGVIMWQFGGRSEDLRLPAFR